MEREEMEGSCSKTCQEQTIVGRWSRLSLPMSRELSVRDSTTHNAPTPTYKFVHRFFLSVSLLVYSKTAVATVTTEQMCLCYYPVS